MSWLFRSKKRKVDVDDDLEPFDNEVNGRFAPALSDMAVSNEDIPLPRPVSKLASVTEECIRNASIEYKSTVNYEKAKELAVEDAIPIVIDLGTGFLKYGFGGEDAPLGIIRNVCGKIGDNEESETPKNDFVVGDDVFKSGCDLVLKNPMIQQMIMNWYEMEIILDYVISERMKTSSNSHPIVLLEPPNNHPVCRQKLTKIIFESFCSPQFFLGGKVESCLISSGRTTGLVIDCGFDSTNIVPIYEGSSIRHSSVKLPIGGNHVTQYLRQKLKEKTSRQEYLDDDIIIRKIKEECCYICHDPDSELIKANENIDVYKFDYTLPDGSKISLETERFLSTECLMKPSLLGFDKFEGIPMSCFETIQSCDIDLRKDLYQNLVVCGGGSGFEGIVERWSQDIQFLSPRHSRIKLNASVLEERKVSSWIGASILSSLSTFQREWISIDEYEEFGSSIVNRKCIDHSC